MTNPPNHPEAPPLVMTAEERAKKLFRESIDHHALYAGDAEKIPLAIADAIRAAEADAFRRGAEAMREKCLSVCIDTGFHDAVENIRTDICALPLPQPSASEQKGE